MNRRALNLYVFEMKNKHIIYNVVVNEFDFNNGSWSVLLLCLSRMRKIICFQAFHSNTSKWCFDLMLSKWKYLILSSKRIALLHPLENHPYSIKHFGLMSYILRNLLIVSLYKQPVGIITKSKPQHFVTQFSLMSIRIVIEAIPTVYVPLIRKKGSIEILQVSNIF